MNKLLNITVLFIFSFTVINAQNTFQKYFGLSGDEQVKKVIPTSDNGFVVTGFTESAGKGGQDIFLSKFTNSGDLEWTKTYGGEALENPVSVVQTSDGGYLIVGHTRTYTFGENDMYILKTTSDGTMTWNKTYGGTDKELAWDAVELSGQDYLILGQSQSYSHGLLDVTLTRINSSGNVIWAKAYGGAQNDWCYNMRETNDGDFLLAGATFTYGSGRHDMMLMKVDENGTLTFCKVFGDSGEDYAYCSNQDALGNYLVVGKTSSVSGNFDNIFVKLDNNLNPVFEKVYGGTGEELANNVLPTDENGYYVTGWTYSYGAGMRDVYLTNFSSTGVLNWLKAYGGEEDDMMPQKSAYITSFDKILIAGSTQSNALLTFRSNDWNGYLIKTDFNGVSGCNEISYTPTTKNTNFNFTDITTTIGVKSITFQTSSGGEGMSPGFELVNLCYTGLSELLQDAISFNIQNPFSTELSLMFKEAFSGELRIEIYDIMGQLMYQTVIEDNFAGEKIIPTNNWGLGVYMIRLNFKNFKYSKKLIKYE